MSGGTFEYEQYHIKEIHNAISEILYGNESVDSEIAKEIIEKHPEFEEDLKMAKDALAEAYIFTQRIDWLLACDDGYDTYKEKLIKDFSNYYKNKPKEL